ncbi:MAG: isoamylase early set domain-containing protein [bacterium]
MPITKELIPRSKSAIVTFTVPIDISSSHTACSIVGDFNNWNPTVHQLRRSNFYSPFSIKIELPVNKTYEFKFLFEDSSWYVENEADGFIQNVHGTQNSLLIL